MLSGKVSKKIMKDPTFSKLVQLYENKGNSYHKIIDKRYQISGFLDSSLPSLFPVSYFQCCQQILNYVDSLFQNCIYSKLQLSKLKSCQKSSSTLWSSSAISFLKFTRISRSIFVSKSVSVSVFVSVAMTRAVSSIYLLIYPYFLKKNTVCKCP